VVMKSPRTMAVRNGSGPPVNSRSAQARGGTKVKSRFARLAIAGATVAIAIAGGQAVGAMATSSEQDQLLSASDCPEATTEFEQAGLDPPTAYESCPDAEQIEVLKEQFQVMADRRSVLEEGPGEVDDQ
jgi:hypothetical protein